MTIQAFEYLYSFLYLSWILSFFPIAILYTKNIIAQYNNHNIKNNDNVIKWLKRIGKLYKLFFWLGVIIFVMNTTYSIFRLYTAQSIIVLIISWLSSGILVGFTAYRSSNFSFKIVQNQRGLWLMYEDFAVIYYDAMLKAFDSDFIDNVSDPFKRVLLCAKFDCPEKVYTEFSNRVILIDKKFNNAN